MKIIAVTGTNGKTSTTHYIAQFLHLLKHQVAVIGTVGYGIWGQPLKPAMLTTPGQLELKTLLTDFEARGVNYVVMEASSHGLSQNRLAGITIEAAIFTNLTQDHLDYHGSFDEYIKAKAKLFAWPDLKIAVCNVDDSHTPIMLAATSMKTQCYLYGLEAQPGISLQAQKVQLMPQGGMDCQLQGTLGEANCKFNLIGLFNLSNALAAITCLAAMGFAFNDLVQFAPQLKSVRGRMECLRYPNQPLVVIDYAHTPDALAKALQALRPFCKGQLWVVFGCGGDRDRTKRPLMARAAQTYSDHVIVTADNSRFEDKQEIFHDIRLGFQRPLAGIPFVIDRGDAIASAIVQAKPEDVILLAGKGHETYIEEAGRKKPFDERDVVDEVIVSVNKAMQA